MKVTRADVAQEAGVSPATVSYVLNDSRYMAQETCDKVLQAVKRLNYKPDAIARGLVTRQTMQIALVLNDIANPFFGAITRAFEHEAMENSYFVSICSGEGYLDSYLDNFLSRRMDGVVILATPNNYQLDKIIQLSKSGIRVLLSGNLDISNNQISSIEHDYVDGMLQAVRHLTQLGHTNIAYISCFNRSVHFDPRIDGYHHALAQCGLGDRPLLVEGEAPYPSTIESGAALTRRLLDSGRLVTALICTNDLMAIGAMQTLKARGLRVPEDVSVIGCDDIIVAPMMDPPLTTLAIDKESFGRQAFHLLYRSIKEDVFENRKNTVELTVRASTAPRR